MEACWAHNPEVRGSKPRSAITFAVLSVLLCYQFGASVQWKQKRPSGNYKVTILTQINRLRPQKTCRKLTKKLAKRSDGFVNHTVLEDIFRIDLPLCTGLKHGGAPLLSACKKSFQHQRAGLRYVSVHGKPSLN